ncbi:flavin-dependent monooxygenase QhpG [Luteithermobacter gelatinilyticus]|uniref:flavin-dependent monooxygenase QhpG n=1 Tax=Luteithermobacter gelatinilyticus TaxID=2582913 RepID=UPI0011072547|nr:hypothetical protein [Luteithermobacter gelatinilyticus]
MAEDKVIIVMGGGPAGVMTAVGLADLGHHVTLITRMRPFDAWEGLSERGYETLKAHRLDAALDSVGPRVPRQVSWGGARRRVNHEYILNRRLFDQALLWDAARRHVNVVEASAGGVSLKDKSWQVSAGGYVYEADYLVEARGREAGQGQKSGLALGLSQNRGREITLPLSALYRPYVLPRHVRPMTAVASFEHGWAWFVSGEKSKAVLQIFVDSERGDLPPRARLGEYFTGLAEGLKAIWPFLKDAEARGEVKVRHAASRISRPLIGLGSLRVGDAAVAMDPLSGHGIFEALGGGLAAVPVVNTWLRKPENRALAQAYYESRMEQSFVRLLGSQQEFYRQEQRWSKGHFWKKRHDLPLRAASHPPPLSAPAQIETKPVVCNGIVEAAQVVVTPDHPRGVWQVAGVELVTLLDLYQQGCQDISTLAQQLDQAPEHIGTALNWLAYRNLLELS